MSLILLLLIFFFFLFFFFFFNDTATTEIYTLSLHDALAIRASSRWSVPASSSGGLAVATYSDARRPARRPKTIVSNKEFPPRRLAPWTLTQAHSPAAYRPARAVSPHVLVLMPPIT